MLWTWQLAPLAHRHFGELALSGPWDCVAPIPQHRARSWRLGGNPADVWARVVAKHLNIPRIDALAWRGRATQERQARRSRWERHFAPTDSNITGRPQLCESQRLLLVDDFMTTGHTLRVGARAALEAGARRVGLVSLGLKPLAKADWERDRGAVAAPEN